MFTLHQQGLPRLTKQAQLFCITAQTCVRAKYLGLLLLVFCFNKPSAVNGLLKQNAGREARVLLVSKRRFGCCKR